MSHYTLCKTNITNKDCLIKALTEVGFKEHMLEYSEEKMSLRGYSGDTRAQKANLRIKGAGWKGANYVGSASNDLGWELMEDGTYAFHVSEYDKHKYNTIWQNKLMQQYSKAVVEQTAEEFGYYQIDTGINEEGEIYLEVQAPF